MLLDLPIHDTLLPRRLLDSREEVDLLEMMVRFNEAVPSQTVPDEVLVVALSKPGCLLVDAVVASDQRVVT